MERARGPALVAAGGLPAVAALFLPKCPLCAAIYLGVFGFALPAWAGLAAVILAAVALGVRASIKGRPLAGLIGITAALGLCLFARTPGISLPTVGLELLLAGSFLALERPGGRSSPRARLRPCCR